MNEAVKTQSYYICAGRFKKRHEANKKKYIVNNMNKNDYYVDLNNVDIRSDFSSFLKNKELSINISKKNQAIFGVFLCAIIMKFQALKRSGKLKEQENFEFWYTGFDTKKDIGISYYMRKKCIKIGVELGLWTCEAKHNPQFKGGINKLDHFLLNWDNIYYFNMRIAVIEHLSLLEKQSFGLTKLEEQSFDPMASLTNYNVNFNAKSWQYKN